MPWNLRPTLYSLALALATPAAGDPLDPSLATGAMARLEVLDAAAPPVTTFARADGSTGDLSDHAGQVVVLNFWATWCAPCRAEMPSLQALQDAMGDEGVAVVTVAFGRHAPQAMRRFWDEAGVTTLPLNLDAESVLARGFGVRGLPHTILLDREGRVAGQVVGDADWNAPETRAVLRRLLE